MARLCIAYADSSCWSTRAKISSARRASASADTGSPIASQMTDRVVSPLASHRSSPRVWQPAIAALASASAAAYRPVR